MRCLFKILLFSFIVTLTLSAHAHAKTYVNGIDTNYPPFAYVNDKGEPDGLDVKAMDWIANEMGFKVKHMPMDWDIIIPTLNAGKIDMICSGMTISDERMQKVRFTEPYWSFSSVMVAKTGNNLSIDTIYNTPVKLGVQRGTSEHTYLEQKKIHEKLRYSLFFYSTGPLAVEDLANGRIDAVAMDIFPAQDAIARRRPVTIIGAFSEENDFGVAIRKNKSDDTLYNLVNEGYKRLQNDPYWEELKSIYLK